MSELKPCPFCSAPAVPVSSNNKEWVDCAACDFALGPFENKGAAIEAWNRRAPVEPQWRPIESAPKDGSRILLRIDHGPHNDQVWTGLWVERWIISYGEADAPPTHWMPLPTPPQTAVDKE